MPCGLTISTTKTTRNGTASAQLTEIRCAVSPRKVPIIRPPTNAAGSDENPPMTAATKPAKMMLSPFVGVRLLYCVCNVMAIVEITVARPHASIDTRDGEMPSTLATDRFSAMARIRTPHGERKKTARAAASTTPTTIVTSCTRVRIASPMWNGFPRHTGSKLRDSVPQIGCTELTITIARPIVESSSGKCDPPAKVFRPRRSAQNVYPKATARPTINPRPKFAGVSATTTPTPAAMPAAIGYTMMRCMTAPNTNANTSDAAMANPIGTPLLHSAHETYAPTRPISLMAKLGTSVVFITTTTASAMRL